MMTKASATAMAAWLLKTHPGIFAAILKRQGAKLSGLGDASTIDMSLFPTDTSGMTATDFSSVAPVDTSGLTATDFSSIAPVDTSVANVTTPDLLSSLGSGLSSAVSNVGSFLLKGTTALAPVAIAALNAQTSTANRNAQLAVLGAQMNRANAGLAPANIAYTASGTPVYVPSAPASGGLTSLPAGLGAPVTLSNGQTGYTLTPQALANVAPTFLQQYGIWLIGGGALIVLALVFS